MAGLHRHMLGGIKVWRRARGEIRRLPRLHVGQIEAWGVLEREGNGGCVTGMRAAGQKTGGRDLHAHNSILQEVVGTEGSEM